MNGYICCWNRKRVEVYADTSYHAQTAAAKQLGAKRPYEISVYLAEKDGQSVIHIADF